VCVFGTEKRLLSLIFQFLLPFTSSAFVRPASMPAGLRWFAEYQPFTPVIDTLRGLLLGTPIGHSAVLAVAWCAGLTLVGYLWARGVQPRSRTVARPSSHRAGFLSYYWRCPRPSAALTDNIPVEQDS